MYPQDKHDKASLTAVTSYAGVHVLRLGSIGGGWNKSCFNQRRFNPLFGEATSSCRQDRRLCCGGAGVKCGAVAVKISLLVGRPFDVECFPSIADLQVQTVIIFTGLDSH